MFYVQTYQTPQYYPLTNHKIKGKPKRTHAPSYPAASSGKPVENSPSPEDAFGGSGEKSAICISLVNVLSLLRKGEGPSTGALFTCPKSRFTTWATVKTVAQVVISIAQVVISIAQVVLPVARTSSPPLKIHKLFTEKLGVDRKLVRTT